MPWENHVHTNLRMGYARDLAYLPAPLSGVANTGVAQALNHNPDRSRAVTAHYIGPLSDCINSLREANKMRSDKLEPPFAGITLTWNYDVSSKMAAGPKTPASKLANRSRQPAMPPIIKVPVEQLSASGGGRKGSRHFNLAPTETSTTGGSIMRPDFVEHFSRFNIFRSNKFASFYDDHGGVASAIREDPKIHTVAGVAIGNSRDDPSPFLHRCPVEGCRIAYHSSRTLSDHTTTCTPQDAQRRANKKASNARVSTGNQDKARKSNMDSAPRFIPILCPHPGCANKPETWDSESSFNGHYLRHFQIAIACPVFDCDYGNKKRDTVRDHAIREHG